MRRAPQSFNAIPLIAIAASTAVHALPFALFVLGSTWGGFSQSRIKPIEIEIIFEEELPELEASALLEDLDMLVEDESEQTPVAEEDLPILEPAPPADFDPLFLPDSSEFEDLPDGLEEFQDTGQTNSNLNADLSEDMVSTGEFSREPANDQFPRADDLAANEEPDDALAVADDGASALVAEAPTQEEAPEAAETTEEATETTPPVNLPLIPKPRPRAAPTYRDLDQEQREADAAAEQAEADSIAASETAGETAESTSENSETTGSPATSTSGAKTEAQSQASRLVQACIGTDWSYPQFIQNPRSWQVTFRLNLDAEGQIISSEDGKIAYPQRATPEMIEAFRDASRDNVYGCEGFANPEGDTGQPFEIEVILAPGAAINASN